MTLTWGEPFVPATHIYKDGLDMCHTCVLSFAASEHLCATTCARAWSTYQLQGLQSWWSCQAVDGPHTHLRVLGRKACGVGPGLVFAAHLLRSGGAQRMGLVPCAVGGTAMDRWVPGADLYEQMARPLHPKSDADMSAPGQPALRTHVPEAPRLHMRMPSRAVQPQAGQSYTVWTSQANICHVAATLVSLQARARVPGHRIHSDACFGCMRPAPLGGGGGATSMGGPDRQVSRAQSAVDAAPGPASLRVLLWYQVRATASVHACVGTVATCLSSVSPLPQSSTCAVLLPG